MSCQEKAVSGQIYFTLGLAMLLVYLVLDNMRAGTRLSR
jgi:uncharacterized membrane protein YtjA (UPF0391 family)